MENKPFPFEVCKQCCTGGSGGGAVNSVNGKTGDVVLIASDVGAYTTEETDVKLNLKADKSEIPTVPKKISDLDDDTTPGNGIQYAQDALNAHTADEAIKAYEDGSGNNITGTYATKSELPTKISDLVDDTYETMPIGRADVCYQADYAKRADEAGLAGHADDASRDNKGNIIHETYATKEELENQKDETSKIGELIEEITITEEGIQTIKRNAEPDGTPYNFKAVAIYQEAKPCTVDNTITFNGFSDAECKIALWSGQGRNTKAEAGRFISIWADVFAGSWYVLMNATTIQGSPTGVTGARNMLPYNGEKIKSIKIQGYNTALEVGTKIQIYGVR